MIVALCLGAIDCHLSGRRRGGRSCSAPSPRSAGPRCGRSWRSTRSGRGGAVPSMRLAHRRRGRRDPALWFGIPALTSRTPFVAGQQRDGLRARRCTQQPGLRHDRPLPRPARAGRSRSPRCWRWRSRSGGATGSTLVLAAGAVAWVCIEIAFSLHGWPGLPRYMFEAGGVMVVLAGGRLRLAARRIAPDLARRPRWRSAVVLLAVVAVGALVPPAVSRARSSTATSTRSGAHRGDQPPRRVDPRARRARPTARLRRAADPARVPDDPRVARSASTSPASASSTGQAIPRGNPIVLFTPYPTGIAAGSSKRCTSALPQLSPATCRGAPLAAGRASPRS